MIDSGMQKSAGVGPETFQGQKGQANI